MSHVDFSDLRKSRKPTKKEISLYRRWAKYLKNSKLDEKEIHKRASIFAERGKTPKE